MDFTHTSYQPGETIAAIATPPGEGGVAIIRISGKDAIALATQVFSKNVEKLESHRVQYGQILNHLKERVDDVLILPMRAPKTYTGEDTVEIFCHGGSLITRKVLDVVLAQGARAAYPGEFTFKAFINGKIDLTQAEAVQSLIGAKNEKALSAAALQLEGGLSGRIGSFQAKLTHIAAILDAWVDFPEEGLEFASFEEIISELLEIKGALSELSETFHEGKILHDGLSLSLIGAPNVGKSSLMNALLDKERAIVSPIAGTTRDVLEDQMRLCGLNFRILDTAGIRETEEIIEKEGIKRSKKAMLEADLVLLILDSQEAQPFPLFFSEIPHHKTILVWNKCDLPHAELADFGFEHLVQVSALKREGLKELKQEIEKIIWKKGPPSKDEVIITNIRHDEAIKEAIALLSTLIDGLQENVSPEFLTFEMRTLLGALGKIMGTNVSEDILNAIFSKFCIGK